MPSPIRGHILMPFVGSLVLVTMLAAGAAACSTSSARNATPTRNASIAAPTVALKLTPGATVIANRRPAYLQAISVVQQYLSAWVTNGQVSANKYVVPGMQAANDDVRLLNGRVISYAPVQWTSSNNFVLAMTMDLRFPDNDGIAYREGMNTRFVTFTRASASSSLVMSFATSPPLGKRSG